MLMVWVKTTDSNLVKTKIKILNTQKFLTSIQGQFSSNQTLLMLVVNTLSKTFMIKVRRKVRMYTLITCTSVAND
jgi:hypothetical protein